MIGREGVLFLHTNGWSSKVHSGWFRRVRNIRGLLMKGWFIERVLWHQIWHTRMFNLGEI